MAMPAFGDAYSDAEIAAAAHYATARFGAEASRLTAQNVAALRLTRSLLGSGTSTDHD
jgi:mono/diheme cytochrome c family protein